MSRRIPVRTWLFLAVAVFFLAPVVAGMYGDWLWFGTLGYGSVFVARLAYQVGVFLAVAGASFALLYAGMRWAVRNVRKDDPDYHVPRRVIALLGLVAVYAGMIYAGRWDIVLKYLNQVAFGTVDPIFGKDVAFYVFALPFYRLVTEYLIVMVPLSLVASLYLYGVKWGMTDGSIEDMTMGAAMMSGGDFDLYTTALKVKRYAYTHVSVFLAVTLFAAGGSVWLSRYAELFGGSGVVNGVGYTAANVTLPYLTVLAVSTVLGGVVVLANARWKRDRYVYGVIAALIAVSVLGGVAQSVVQSTVVAPDELNKERPYIQNEIQFTRQGFDLSAIQGQQFRVEQELSRAELDANNATVENIRLWDWRPLLKTYNELQIFRSYYTFRDVDVDRYTVNGTDREVMLAPREIDLSGLPEGTRSWVNEHMVYTHGYGVAMSPVSKVTQEGLPKLWIRDIPPKTIDDVPIDQPRIYYGEEPKTYAIVGTDTQELDYPAGDSNVYNTYEGGGGVRVGGALRRTVFGLMMGAPQILFSGSINPDSRIQFHRAIKERVHTIAPFLELDQDPYMVVVDGRLKWVVDAYMTSSSFPYSKAVDFKGEDARYVRNSVKVVVDAYSGETTFYVAEEEPLVEAYRGIFPGLFRDFEEMPDAVQDHVRYPEDLFSVQAEQYKLYHMQEPRVFYNKEDAWRVPNEVFRGNEQQMEPYYLVMRLPGEDEAEFVQILPFVPQGKENMIGWLAARSDTPNYGNITAFQFSKQELVFGPMQIESRISQDTTISQQITLWSQAGSSVLRGNLLAIPIADTILYVEPLFLQATGEGSLPQLKQAIVAQGDRLTMQPSLDMAMDALFGDAPAQAVTGPALTPELLQEARRLYQESQTALQQGDFSTYAERIEELGATLNEMERSVNTTAAQ